MSLTELDRESRQISIGQQSITEKRVYGLCIIDEYIDDITDHQIALDYFYSNVPAFTLLDIQGNTYTLILNDLNLKHNSMYSWTVEATYTLPQGGGSAGGGGAESSDLVKIGFNTTGGTKTMTKSLSVQPGVARTGYTDPVPDFNITGVEVQTRGFGFNLTVYFPPSIWNNGFINTIYMLSKCTNNAPFFGFAPGEVLFIDGSAEGDFYSTVPVTYNFIANPNTVASPDPGFPPLTATGHEIVDYVFYENEESFQVTSVPTFRYVHQVYESANLSLLFG